MPPFHPGKINSPFLQTTLTSAEVAPEGSTNKPYSIFFPKHLSSCRLLPLEAGTTFPLSHRFSGNLLLFVEDAVKAGVFSHRLECVSWILLPCDMTAHINRHAWSSSCSSVLYYRSLSQLRIYEDWGEITFLLPKKKLIHLNVDISGIWVAYYLLNSLVLFYRPRYFNLS